MASEEYVSDCVILLDHRIIDQQSTRRLRIVKYRGSPHGTNEYPFLIDENGITVLPITSINLDYVVSDERVSTGVPALDDMFGGLGYFVGSTVLITGTAGTGKTTLASTLCRVAMRAGAALSLRLLRGVAKPTQPEHAVGRNQPREVRARGAAPVSGRAPECVWP